MPRAMVVFVCEKQSEQVCRPFPLPFQLVSITSHLRPLQTMLSQLTYCASLWYEPNDGPRVQTKRGSNLRFKLDSRNQSPESSSTRRWAPSNSAFSFFLSHPQAPGKGGVCEKKVNRFANPSLPPSTSTPFFLSFFSSFFHSFCPPHAPSPKGNTTKRTGL